MYSWYSTCVYPTRQLIGESNIHVHVYQISLWEAIGRFYIGNSSYHVEFLCLELWHYGHVHIVNNICDVNIGKFSENHQSPIVIPHQ